MKKALAVLTAIVVLAMAVAAVAAITVVVDKATLTYEGSRMEQVHIWGQLTMDDTYATGGESLVIGTLNTAMSTAGYIGSCTTLERLYIANGEVSDVPYVLAWDDENAKVQAFDFTAGSAVTVATTGVASVPTLVTMVTAEACTIDTTTCTLTNVPIASLIAIDAAGGDQAGKAMEPVLSVSGTDAGEVAVNPTSGLLTLEIATDATVLNVAYSYVATAGTANTPTVITGGTASTLSEVDAATDLSGLEIEFYAVCTQ